MKTGTPARAESRLASEKEELSPTQELEPLHSSEVARHVPVKLPHSIHLLFLIHLGGKLITKSGGAIAPTCVMSA